MFSLSSRPKGSAVSRPSAPALLPNSMQGKARALADKGFSQAEIAEELGLSDSRISQLLKGYASQEASPASSKATALEPLLDSVTASLASVLAQGDLSPGELTRLLTAIVGARRAEVALATPTATAADQPNGGSPVTLNQVFNLTLPAAPAPKLTFDSSGRALAMQAEGVEDISILTASPSQVRSILGPQGAPTGPGAI
jgi:predicted transcriptional regulator